MTVRIRVLSDLHLEFHPFTYVDQGEDVVVLAGDIATPDRRGRFCRLLDSIEKPVVLVTGNHDYYRGTLDKVDADMRDLQLRYPQLRVLQDSTVEILGVRFVGGTLWTDMNLYQTREESSRIAQRCISDFSEIQHEGRPINPTDMLSRWITCRDEIERQRADKRPMVVVTHFVPCRRSVAPQYQGNTCNPYFCSDCADLFGDPVAVWIHGHTHTCFDYQHRGTRVVCNPRGYPDENKAFNAKLVIDVPSPA